LTPKGNTKIKIKLALKMQFWRSLTEGNRKTAVVIAPEPHLKTVFTNGTYFLQPVLIWLLWVWVSATVFVFAIGMQNLARDTVYDLPAIDTWWAASYFDVTLLIIWHKVLRRSATRSSLVWD
jgi:hypothetical protein